MFQQAPRRAHEDVAGQHGGLFHGKGSASTHGQRHLERFHQACVFHRFANIGKHRVDLHGQFAGREHHQGAAPRHDPISQGLDGRDGEHQCFSTSRGGGDADVFVQTTHFDVTVEDQRQSSSLYWEKMMDFVGFQRFDKVFVQAPFFAVLF